VTVQTAYTGEDENHGNIILGTLPLEEGKAVLAGDTITFKTINSDIFGGLDVRTTDGSVYAETDQGSIGFFGDVYAGGEITAKVKNEGDIVFTDVHSAGTATVTDEEGNTKEDINITAETAKGNIEFTGTVAADNGSVIAKTGDGNIDFTQTGTTVTAANDIDLQAGADGAGQDPQDSPKGNITVHADLNAGHDVIANATAGDGDITVNGAVTAGNDVKATAGAGDIAMNGDTVTALNNVKLTTGTGSIQTAGTVTATNENVEAVSAFGGDIVFGGAVVAGQDIKAATTLDPDTGSEGSITAEKSLFVILNMTGSLLYVTIC
ncbi:MAG: hypothetical protein VZR73_18515, partial [Acutalibacteraceae bacterium]|nr:hypothetical protein [Acutalibacteraceae bacterium]